MAHYVLIVSTPKATERATAHRLDMAANRLWEIAYKAFKARAMLTHEAAYKALEWVEGVKWADQPPRFSKAARFGPVTLRIARER